ncbi:MAG: TetR/AcrR family transcriptional regulator, partial [Spirochaetales bacterium]|nr:TetR/AcrR family transcriptional regulator [Spirochaetales bacterium]
MSEAKRLTLIRIGERLFSKQGYRDVGIEDVVNAAGISAGSFYNYFESKEIFYSEILDHIENQGAKRLEKMIAKLSSPINKLRVVYRFVTLGIKHNPMLRGVLAGDEKYIFPGTEERRIRGNDIRARVQRLIVVILREGSAKGLFRSSVFRNPNVLLTSLYDVILHHIDSEHFDSLLEDILTLLDRGLRRQIQ